MFATMKYALRNLRKQKSYAVINGVGLILGLAASVLMLFYVYHEMGYDKHHTNWQRIYRITTHDGSGSLPSAGAPHPLKPFAEEYLTNTESICRLSDCDIMVVRNDQSFNESLVLRADPTFFDVFTWNLLAGDSNKALSDPNSVVLTESTARKYFGSQDPIGQVLKFRTRRGTRFDEEIHLCKVSGVLADFPVQSHIQANIILPMSTLIWGYENINRKKSVPSYESWQWGIFHTYCLMPPGTDVIESEKVLNEEYKAHFDNNMEQTFHLQPLKDIHFSGGEYGREIIPRIQRSKIKLFAGVAVVILMIAVINTIILSMAQAARRSREVGIRKIMGARTSDLARQLLGENLLFSLMVLPLAGGLVIVLLPIAEMMFETRLAPEVLLEWPFLVGIAALTVITGISSGGYLAASLSRLSPIETLNQKLNSAGRTHVRNALIVLQLMVFLLLSSMAIIIFKQINFLFSGQQLGFNATGVVSVEIHDRDFSKRFSVIKRELKMSPDILAVSSSQEFGPANTFRLGYYYQQMHPKLKRTYWGSGSGRITSPHIIKEVALAYSAVDPDFVPALGLELVAGRNFDSSIPSDRQAILVNETFIREREIIDPINREIQYIDEKRRIIGVLKDFHTGNLYDPVPPLILRWNHQWMNQIILKINEEHLQAAIAHLNKVWSKFYPDSPLNYHYLEDDQRQIYDAEMRFGQLLAGFAILAIVIAMMGLWGLAAFIAAQKTHEIGVRKVLGASATRIVKLLSTDFVLLVIAANLVAVPLALHLGQKWLQQYTYRIDLSPDLFVLTGMLSLMLTLLAVNLHVIRAARLNPVKTLRDE
ncbi:ABC transporter permease [bacterium]|nr:ABC transporter permease [bacterium]